MGKNGGQNSGAQPRQQQTKTTTDTAASPAPKLTQGEQTGGNVTDPPANQPIPESTGQDLTAGKATSLPNETLPVDDPHYGTGANLPAADDASGNQDPSPLPEVAQQANPAMEPTAFLVTALKPKAGSTGVVVLDLETPDASMGITLDMTADEASGCAIEHGKLVYVYPDGTYTVPKLPPMQVARPGTNTRAATQPQPAAAPVRGASTELNVLDSTATISYPKREHTIIVNGEEITYLFENGKPRSMPASHAMKFVKHTAFHVTDPATGKRFEPIADPSQRQVSIAALAPNQVIASLDELTPKALLHRCHTLNGGERYGANSDPREMIAFIIAATTPQRAEGGDEELDSAQLDRMLGR